MEITSEYLEEITSLSREVWYTTDAMWVPFMGIEPSIELSIYTSKFKTISKYLKQEQDIEKTKEFDSLLFKLKKDEKLEDISRLFYMLRIRKWKFIGESRKDFLLMRISNIIDELTKNEKYFAKLDKSNLIKFLFKEMEEILADKLINISNEELSKRIKKIMLIDRVSNLYNNLSREQREHFDEFIVRRKNFE